MKFQVLSIGNSYSADAQRYLRELARSEKVDLESINLMIGGCPLERHFRNLKGDRKDYILEVNGLRQEGFMTSIKEAIFARKWDVITLQQASQESFIEEAYFPYIEVLAEYIRENCPGTKVMIQQTWAYETGSPRIRQYGFETFDEMFAKIKPCYDKAAEKIKADCLIPSGEAFQHALHMGLEKIHRDTFHARLGVGRFILALVWYRCITGNSIDNVTFCDFDEEVTEREYEIALAAAKAATAHI